MQQITYEQLHNFCEQPDTLRPKLLYPCLMSGRWYATDSKVLISVPKEYVVEDERLYDGCKIEGRYPNVKAVFDEAYFRSQGVVKIDTIKTAFPKLPMVDEYVEKELPINYIDCPCCDDGKIELHESVRFHKRHIDVDHEVDCPVCHGYGKIPDWEDYDPDDDGEYDPDNDTTYTKEVKTGNKIPDYEHGIITCGGSKFNAGRLKVIADFFDSIGADDVDCEIKRDTIIFEYDGIFILLMGVYDEKNEGITAW